MPHVENDPEALDGFKHQLIAFDRLLAEEYAKIVAGWRDMADVWRDDQYDHLGTSLEEVGQGIRAYLDAAESHEQYLQDLVTELEAVRSIRIRR